LFDVASVLVTNHPLLGHLQIISNKNNGVDVDKIDYILRDRYAVGLNTDCIKASDFIDKACVVFTEEGKWELGFHSSMEATIYQLFECRAEMHKIAYQHEAVKIGERMLVSFIIFYKKSYLSSFFIKFL
jgi:HD superfamily phosphohydrolase